MTKPLYSNSPNRNIVIIIIHKILKIYSCNITLINYVTDTVIN